MKAPEAGRSGGSPTLVSHPLCPYVQRVAIVLAEKGVAFERRDVDLASKPDWFVAVSPLGKTPVLLVDGHALFESAVICEFLDETITPRLHPGEALVRARHRGWIAFASVVLDRIAAFYGAPDVGTLDLQRDRLERLFGELEQALAAEGPWFSGAGFSLVDAAFAPVFRYFDAFDRIGDFGILTAKPRVVAWRAALAGRASVIGSVATDFPRRLDDFLRRRERALSTRMPSAPD